MQLMLAVSDSLLHLLSDICAQPSVSFPYPGLNEQSSRNPPHFGAIRLSLNQAYQYPVIILPQLVFVLTSSHVDAGRAVDLLIGP